MSRIRILPIVEGHGEVQAIRPLLTRIWAEIVGGDYAEVLRPIRLSRGKLVKQEGLERALRLGHGKLRGHHDQSSRGLVLVLLDADGDCPARLGPNLAGTGNATIPDDICCVVAKVEYETWFVAAAESLGDFLHLPVAPLPDDPETRGHGKGWIQAHFVGVKYSETADQARMTTAMDLRLARNRSPSFDKLCRELEARVG